MGPDHLFCATSICGTSRECCELCQVKKLGAVIVVVDPLLKADFELIQTYEYRSDLSLECPIE
jgi:surfactin synthase thioesterase subunit